MKRRKLEDYVKFREREESRGGETLAPRQGARLQGGQRIQGCSSASSLFEILFLKSHLTSSVVSLGSKYSS